jgi:cytochrome c553
LRIQFVSGPDGTPQTALSGIVSSAATPGFGYTKRPKNGSAIPKENYMKLPIATRIMAATVFVAAAAPLCAAEGNPAAGSEKNSMCAGCHGIPGYKTAFPEVYSVPKIGGQHAAYIVKALQAYKSGERTHPSMRAIAATLSEQDMADLAAYYSSAQTKSAAK